MSLKNNILKVFTPIILNCLAVTYCHGAGFALSEYSASGLGNANAGGAAFGEDSSVVFFNPAAMADFQREQYDVSLHQIQPSARFSNAGSSLASELGGGTLLGPGGDGGQQATVSAFSYLNPLSDSFKFGVGIHVPFGLSTMYDDSWAGRYHAVESSLQVINVNPAISYTVTERLAIGGGFNIQYAQVALSNAIDFGALCVASFDPDSCQLLNANPQQADGMVRYTGNSGASPATGWNWGLLFRPFKHTHVGAAYRSAMKHKFKGEADYTLPGSAAFATASGAFTDTDVKAEITMPPMFSLSFHQGTELGMDLMADVTWTGWSSIEELRIQHKNSNQPDAVSTQDWENSTRFALGINYRFNETWMMRLGTALDKSPVPDEYHRSARIPDNDRRWATLGLRYSFTEDVLFDLSYLKVSVDEAGIENTLETSVPAMNATLRGAYESSVEVISGQMNWRF